MTLDNGDVYTGQLDEGGRRHGEGRCEYLGSGGGWYIGTWEADEPHGRGERVYPAEGGQQDEGLTGLFAPGRAPPLASYRGHWKRGVRDGNGVCTFTMPTKPSAGSASSTVPDRYEGQWVGGVPLGKGVLHLRVTGGVTGSAIAALRNNSDSGNSSGGFIEGEWAEEGLVRGRETLPDRGGIYEGQYRQGRREGHGRLELSDGSEFEGESFAVVLSSRVLSVRGSGVAIWVTTCVPSLPRWIVIAFHRRPFRRAAPHPTPPHLNPFPGHL